MGRAHGVRGRVRRTRPRGAHLSPHSATNVIMNASMTTGSNCRILLTTDAGAAPRPPRVFFAALGLPFSPAGSPSSFLNLESSSASTSASSLAIADCRASSAPAFFVALKRPGSAFRSSFSDSYSMCTPKERKRTVASRCVHTLEIKFSATAPIPAESTVIVTIASIAPKSTFTRE